uniref:Uncharacterized protein n=1 Tax=Nicotiana tabacum TaxID=4097 RepID=A0A1S4CLG1_TOBAC|nr:PREDICTED: uncharacterized protein LOC107820075 [Nicotiana tabacum]
MAADLFPSPTSIHTHTRTHLRSPSRPASVLVETISTSMATTTFELHIDVHGSSTNNSPPPSPSRPNGPMAAVLLHLLPHPSSYNGEPFTIFFELECELSWSLLHLLHTNSSSANNHPMLAAAISYFLDENDQLPRLLLLLFLLRCCCHSPFISCLGQRCCCFVKQLDLIPARRCFTSSCLDSFCFTSLPPSSTKRPPVSSRLLTKPRSFCCFRDVQPCPSRLNPNPIASAVLLLLRQAFDSKQTPFLLAKIFAGQIRVMSVSRFSCRLFFIKFFVVSIRYTFVHSRLEAKMKY